jgi:hypothetical protein
LFYFGGAARVIYGRDNDAQRWPGNATRIAPGNPGGQGVHGGYGEEVKEAKEVTEKQKKRRTREAGRTKDN